MARRTCKSEFDQVELSNFILWFLSRMIIMLKIFNKISSRTWDGLGVAVGLFACLTIGNQIFHEWSSDKSSTVSYGFIGGFFFVYLFWFFYGVRFARIGIWLPNAVAATLQIIFGVVVYLKQT
jgi:uncharacterized protein with PQ loop repeat